MEQATIIKRDGTKINLISKDPFRAPTSFSQEYGLKSDDYVKISLKSSDMLKLGIGDRIIIGSDTYTIRTNNTTEIVSDNSYTYELTFYGAMYDLMRQMYRNCDAQGKSDKSTFDLTYSLKDFAKVIIYNMERDYPGEWVLDENNVPDTIEKTLTFDGQNCLQVLQTLCSKDNYDYDFLITQTNGVHTLHLGKFGSVITPPNNASYFEVGKGKGLYKLKEDKVDDKSIITRLYVEGGSTNIRSEYRNYAGRLQLPYPQRANTRAHTLSDGTVIAAGSMTIGITDDTKRYFEDADLKSKIGSIEDYDKTDNIFPCRTGKVTALGADVYSFVDDTMDFDLNEKDSNGTKWLIADTTAKITFTSGYLAGQQFELKKSGGYKHSTKSFSIIKYTDERGMSFPSETAETFQIRVGDTYKITDINLPTAYENDSEEDLWFYGYDKFLQAKQARVQYTATFTEDFFLHHLPTDSTADIFHVGDYLPIKDTRFGVAKNIRITKVTRNLMKRYDYTITVSDTNTATIESQIVDEVMNHETIINKYGMKDPSKARRGWRTTEDLRNMVFDTDGYFDGTNIKPNSIDTNMLTVGSKSQQFVLVGITLQANVNGLPNRFDASAGILAHLTISEDSIKMWNLTATSVTLAESGGYYVYAKCSKSGNTGSYYITQEQLKFEPASDVDNYYFLIGVIGSLHADDNFRDFATTYGFTRINGRTITTGRIISSDGNCFLDLDSNLFQLADSSSINTATSGIGWSNGKLIVKGVLMQNQGGTTGELGLYRGTYNSSTVYYKGDEVSYNDGSQTCTYRYTNQTAGSGNIPTNSSYWSIVAKGAQGDKGDQGVKGKDGVNGSDGVNGKDGTSIIWKGTYDSAPSTPLNGWAYYNSNTKKSYVYQENTWFQMSVDGIDGKDGINGVNGTNGTNGKSIVWKGDLTTAPTNPELNWVYRDTDNGRVYIYNGTAWTLMVLDGSNGVDGAKGTDGNSVYITYNSNTDKPNAPRFDGTKNDWHTDPTSTDIWMSQKVSKSASDGTWGEPIKIKGDKGDQGNDGAKGADGDYYEYRYAVNGSTTISPTIINTDQNPDGWSTVMPDVTSLQYLWMSIAKKASTGTLLQNWSTPIRTNPVDGINAQSIYIKGTGFNRLTNAIVQINGVICADVAKRGLTLVTINRTSLTISENISYDTYGSTDDVNNLIAKLNSLDDSVFVCLLSYDAVTFTDGIVTALRKFGSIDVNNMSGRFPFAFLGLKGLPNGYAMQMQSSDSVDAAYAEITAYVSNGMFSTTKSGDKGDKGDKGENPVLVFRGIYDASKTYYGTTTRLDAVKYNGVYYIARIDAGSFSGTLPTATEKWNTFGAELETIATNLLLAEGANIGDWFMSGGKIVSTLSTGNKITLDASAGEIILVSSTSGGDYAMPMLTGMGSKITLNVNTGVIEVEAVTKPSYSTATSYLSPTGIFANCAGTNAMPAGTGYTHQASIVGLGFADVDKNEWSMGGEDTIIAGIYGRADNVGTAPAYGGFFYKLFAGGLTLGRLPITSTSTVYLSSSTSLVIGYTSSEVLVYLPTDATEGTIIIFKQWWTGNMKVMARGGQVIYDDDSQNDYTKVYCGQMMVAHFNIGYVTSGGVTTKKETWLINTIKGLCQD